jgi:hypothetical protein
MGHKFISLLLLCVIAPLSGQDFYPRMKDGVWWYGANHVYVGQDVFMKYADKTHPPSIQRAITSSAATFGDDYRDVTCNASTDTFSTRGFNLPNGTAVQFKYDATLPTPIKGWKEQRSLWYYIINSSPSTKYIGQGTFQLSLTSGGSAIDITDTGGTCSTPQGMSFAGWKSVMTFDVPQTYHVALDPDTDTFQTFTNGGVAVAHGLPVSGTGNGAFFTTEGTYPTEANTSGLAAFSGGDWEKRCVVTTDDPTKFKTRKQSLSQACPSTYLPPNDTFQVRCGDISSDPSAGCRMLNGDPKPGLFMRVRVVSVDSGTLPPNIIRLAPALPSTSPWTTDTDLWILQGESENSTDIRLAPPEGGAVRITWSTAGGPFTVTMRMMTDDYTSAGTGQLHVSNSNTNVWVKSMSVDTGTKNGWPQGTLHSWRQGTNMIVEYGIGGSSVTTGVDTNNAYRYGRIDSQATEGTGTAYRLTLISKIPAITAPGTYNVAVKFDQSNGNTSSADVNAKTFTIPMIMETLVPASGASLDTDDFTEVPGKSIWEALMTSTTDGGGAQASTNLNNKRCEGTRSSIAQVATDMGNIGFSSQDQRTWFYEGDRTFFKISDYLAKNGTPDETWRNCAEYISNDMMQDFKAGSVVNGWSWRLGGIYIMGEHSQVDKFAFKDVMRRVSRYSVYTRGDTTDTVIREAGTSFERRLLGQMINGEPDPSLEAFAESAINWFLMWGNASTYPSRLFNQPWMMGLPARALIRYYSNYYADPRVPVVLKAYADAVWSWYNPTTHQILYNPEPDGPRCGNRCEQEISAIENNFSSPLFWFTWREYGDNTYRDRGDELFQYATASGNPTTGKEWAQFFYFVWDGMCWRTGECSTTTPQY